MIVVGAWEGAFHLDLDDESRSRARLAVFGLEALVALGDEEGFYAYAPTADVILHNRTLWRVLLPASVDCLRRSVFGASAGDGDG